MAAAEEKAGLLLAHDIVYSHGKRAAEHELAHFSLEDVRRIADCLASLGNAKGTRNICGPDYNLHTGWPWMLTITVWSTLGFGIAALLPGQLFASAVLLWKGKVRAIWEEVPRPTWQMWNYVADAKGYVKAPLQLIEHSIANRAALCVNRKGRFSVRTEGYGVMSHVWAETMAWQTRESWGAVDLSVRKRGIARGHFLKFFDRCGVEWLWVDVIAMPEVLEDMSESEREKTESLRLGVINCLHNIYTKADQVIVIDTTLLRLSTRSPLDVAVCLCMSFWMTRLWTMTETMLAEKVTLKTRDGYFDLDEVIDFLGRNTINDQGRYYKLLLRLWPLRDEKYSGFPSMSMMTRVYFGNEHRHNTEVEINEARALFPIFQMEWQAGWTQHQGLAMILEAHPDDEEYMRKYCEYRSIDFATVARWRKALAAQAALRQWLDDSRGDSRPTAAIDSQTGPDQASTRVRKEVHIWRNGVTVAGSALFRFDDPRTAEALAGLDIQDLVNRKQVSMDHVGLELDLSIHSHADEDYEPANAAERSETNET